MFCLLYSNSFHLFRVRFAQAFVITYSPHPYRVLSSAHSQSNHDRLYGLHTLNNRPTSVQSRPTRIRIQLILTRHLPLTAFITPSSYRCRGTVRWHVWKRECGGGLCVGVIGAGAGDSSPDACFRGEEEAATVLGGNYERI